MADRVHTAHVLTVLNLKGGVGKTHPSWVLASVAQERGQRILLVDLETLGNLSKSFLKYVAFDESVAMLFDPSASPIQWRSCSEPRSVTSIPATAARALFDLSDQKAWERLDGHLALLGAV